MNYEIIDYSEKAIAVCGDTKAIKDDLKSLGGRFNPRLTCGAGWVFPKSKREQLTALVNGESVIVTATPKANKPDDIAMSAELKDEIREEYKKLYSEYDSYSFGKVSNAVKLSDGKIVVMDKQKIQTSFCFGESGHDYDEAVDMAYRVAKTEDYFMSENLSCYDKILAKLENTSEPMPNCYGCTELQERACLQRLKTCYTSEGNIFGITSQWYGWNEQWARHNRMMKGTDDVLFKLEGDDLELVKKLVNFERDKFERRLKAYWKRYGSSKLKTWTYWRDA